MVANKIARLEHGGDRKGNNINASKEALKQDDAAEMIAKLKRGQPELRNAPIGASTQAEAVEMLNVGQQKLKG